MQEKNFRKPRQRKKILTDAEDRYMFCLPQTRLFLSTLLTGSEHLPSVLWHCRLGGRKGIRPVKTEWWGACVVVCLERGADLHMAQLMPLPLTVSCFSIMQIGFTFLVPMHPGCPGKRAVKRVCVCVCSQVAVSPDARVDACAHFDGRRQHTMTKGDSLIINTSKYPLASVCHNDPVNDWFDSMAACLHWNVRKPQRPFSASRASSETPELNCTDFTNGIRL